MNNIARAACLPAATALLGACVNVHPRYPASDIVWEPALLGAWHATREDGKPVTLIIETRPVDIGTTDNRINPDDSAWNGVRVQQTNDPPRQTLNQYLLHYTSDQDPTWTLEGYLLERDGHRFLAFQRNDPFIEKNAGWVLPVHLLWKLQHTPDTLVFASPVDAVAWIPAIEWADAAPDLDARPIPRRSGPARGIRVAESLDRVLDYHSRHAADPAFWHTDAGMRFHR